MGSEIIETFEGSIDCFDGDEALVYFDENDKPVLYRMPAERIKHIPEGDRFKVTVLKINSEIKCEIEHIVEEELFPDPPDHELLSPDELRRRHGSWDEWKPNK